MATKSRPPASSPGSRRNAAPPAQGGRPAWIIALVVALVAVLAVVAFLATRGDDGGGANGGGTEPAGSIVTGTVTVEGRPLPPSQDLGPGDPAVGQPFPVLEGQNLLDGAPLEIADDGRPKVITFLAHWCPHCQAEVPRIQEWLDENGLPEDVDLYAVSTSVAQAQGNFPPASWLVREGWQVPTMADSTDRAAATAAGVSGFPYFVAVDANGDVVERASGELSIAQFEELLDAARRG